MKFARIGTPGEEVPVVVTAEGYLDLRPVTADIDGRFLSEDPVGRTRAAIDRGELDPIPASAGHRIGSPIPRPGAVVCIGLNYAAHAAESGAEPPLHPVVFLKAPNTVGGPDDDVVIPRGSVKTDWEVELGVVIGREAAYLGSPEDAAVVIAGYVVADDISERTYQLEVSGGQWSKGKISRGFTPVGPWLVTPDEFDDSDVRLRSFVNGEPRQDSSTADMIFTTAHIVWHLSQFMTLEPGDLVLTGTPEGVGLSGRFPYLRAGDEVAVEIDGLGRQQHRFVEWSRS